MRKYNCDGQLNQLCRRIAEWREQKGFITELSNVPEKLMLIVTELSEAMEAYRKFSRSIQTAHASAPESANFREELADAAIRLFDLTGSLNIDLEREIEDKMIVNEGRPHKHGKHC